jgi:uncharacterized membrane protein YoaK (UPF0700 family)
MLRACVLAIIAGYADTVGYLRYGAFAGLMTGNTILLGIDIARLELHDALLHAIIIAAFLGGVLIARGLLRFSCPIWGALTAAAAFFVGCGFVDRDGAAPLLAFAMGMQNAAANRFGGVNLNTVFITGNLQKLGEGIVAWLWPPRYKPRESTEGVAIYGLVWLAYMLGAALGAAGHAFLAYPLLLPAAVLPFIYPAAWIGRRDGRARSAR